MATKAKSRFVLMDEFYRVCGVYDTFDKSKDSAERILDNGVDSVITILEVVRVWSVEPPPELPCDVKEIKLGDMNFDVEE